MADSVERRDREEEEEGSKTGSKEHNSGAGADCATLIIILISVCSKNGRAEKGGEGLGWLGAKCKYLQRRLLALAGLRERGRGRC